MEFKRRTAERFRDGTGEQPAALRTKIAINTETFPSFRLLLRPAACRRKNPCRQTERERRFPPTGNRSFLPPPGDRLRHRRPPADRDNDGDSDDTADGPVPRIRSRSAARALRPTGIHPQSGKPFAKTPEGAARMYRTTAARRTFPQGPETDRRNDTHVGTNPTDDPPAARGTPRKHRRRAGLFSPKKRIGPKAHRRKSRHDVSDFLRCVCRNAGPMPHTRTRGRPAVSSARPPRIREAGPAAPPPPRPAQVG